MKSNRHFPVAVVPRQFWFCLAAWTFALSSPGQGAAPDKSHYTLFNPVPVTAMRELNTDRPDKTESPYTVDAGHFQFEMDLVSFTDDRHNSAGDDTHIQSWSVAPVNLKAGLCNRVDFQLILQPHNRVRTSSARGGTVQSQSGFGDVTTRLKLNCWGNDGGPTALGLIPYVKWPAAQDELGNGAVEGGLIVPLALKLPGGWSLGLMAQCDFTRDSAGSGYHPEFIHSATFGHGIVGKLEGYAEFFSAVSTERDSEWIGTADFGLTYGLTANVQLDAGVAIGVTRAADDLTLFLGASFRF